jgi:hypothetical protein
MTRRERSTLAALALGIGCALAAPVTGSADSGRRYDAKGHFDGTYRVSGKEVRLYDRKGNYEGKIVSSPRGRLRYDARGEYEGRGDHTGDDER